MAEGRYLISVQKPDYAQLDTVVTFDEASASLFFTLREVEVPRLAEDTPPVSDEDQPTASDEADQTDQEQTTPSPDPDETSTETDQADIEKVSTAAEESGAALDESIVAAADEPGADDEDEESAVQVGELQVDSEPSGASVWVAGQEVGVTPLLISEVQVGPQQITLRLDGYEDFTTTVDVGAQQQSAVNGKLKQLLGTLKILVKPWGIIYIDGELHKKESSIWYTTRLTPGNHRVRVEHPSLGTWDHVVEVPAGEEYPITIDFNKGDSGSQ